MTYKISFAFTDRDSGALFKFRSRSRLQQHWWTGLHFCRNLGRLVLWGCWNRWYLRKLRAEEIAVRSFITKQTIFDRNWHEIIHLFNRLLTVVTFNVLSLVGASITGCIAGIIGFYIIRKSNEICYPSLLLAYENSDEDCKLKKIVRNSQTKFLTIT